MSIAAIHLSLGQVAATLSLVAVAALVSIWQHADLKARYRRGDDPLAYPAHRDRLRD